jgi:hypothetical protein
MMINSNILKGGNMKIPDKVKFLMVLCSGLIFFISGCVDTSVQTIPSQIVYHSQVQFTNLVAGAGTAALKLNGQSIGDVGFGNESSNMTVQAGSKTLKIKYANIADSVQYLFNTEVDRKFRIFLWGNSTTSSVMKMDQRYIFQTPDIPSDSALVTFFNGSLVDTVLGIAISGPQSANVGTALAPGDFSSMMSLVPGDYSVDVQTVTDLDTTTTTFNYSVAAAHKYSAAVYDSQPTLKFKVFTDD